MDVITFISIVNEVGMVAVIGDGGWGTTLAIGLVNEGYNVTLWGAFADYVELLNKKRENVKFLPGIEIPEKLKITSDLGAAVKGAKYIVLAVPSVYVREVLTSIKDRDFYDAKFISVTKGIEKKSLLRISEVVAEILGDLPLSVLSGPSIAYEVARGMPATVVAASSDLSLAKETQTLFMTERFRVYTSTDVVGVELGGSLKNIIAIASGIADGLGFGANAKAAILTRGMQEIMRLGLAMGARRDTFGGLSCMGDLITTCMSKHSRNRWLGEEIGKGKSPKDAVSSTEMIVEGYVTAKSAFELSKKYDVEMPLVAEIYEILYNEKNPRLTVKALMTRAPKDETA